MHSHLSYLDHLLTHQTLALEALEGSLSKDEIEEWSRSEVERAFRQVVNPSGDDQGRVIRIPCRGTVIAGVRSSSQQGTFLEISSWSFLPPRNGSELLGVIDLIRNAPPLEIVVAFLPHRWMEDGNELFSSEGLHILDSLLFALVVLVETSFFHSLFEIYEIALMT